MKWRKHSSARWRSGGPSVLVGLTMVAVLSAACSSPPPRRSIASLPSSGGSTTTATPTISNAQKSAQSDQDMVNFARCLRNHGVSEPDPVHIAGHSGLSVKVPPRNASTSAALDACNHIIARDVQAKQADAAAIAAPRLAALTTYARCMRSHDISMLDPDQFGDLNLGNVAGVTSDFGRYSPQFRSADRACRHLLPAGIQDDGTGP